MDEDKAWHLLEEEEAFQALGSGREGLSEAEARRRLQEYGRNEVRRERETAWLTILLHQLLNPLVAVLALAAAIALLAGEEIDAIVIGVVIVINTAIGFFQEYRAEAAIEALGSRAAPQADVIRCRNGGDCREISIASEEIVPGDVIVLEPGDKVPADARIFEAANLETDESMLTGESLPVLKNGDAMEEDAPVADRTNLVYGGTIVAEGRGKAVVYATGMNTQMGEIATLIEETEKATSPLQAQTYELSKRLGFLAFFAGFLILGMGFVRGLELQVLFLFSVAAVVSAIPEGLPAVMTITLAVGVNRMARRNAIIRRLPAVDTLGATTVISTDKTGTLTTNQMTVQEIFTAGKTFSVTGSGFRPEGEFQLDGRQVEVQAEEALRLTLRIGALCNDSELVGEEEGQEKRWSIQGDPTEGALIVAARKGGLEKKELEREHPRIDEIPFSAQKKFMATFHETGENEVAVYVKGAPETVLGFCKHILREEGETELTEDDDKEIRQSNEEMAGKALRVLATACRYLKRDEVEKVKEALNEESGELVFAGLIGMMDPPREEVFEAIERCKRSGIKVIMATGDHKVTGEAIARQVGILDGKGEVLTGRDVDGMSKEGDVMREAPRDRETRIIDRRMVFQVSFVAVIMAVGTLWIYLRSLNEADAVQAQTIAFITIAMFQVFNSLNVRSRSRSVFQLGLFSNKYLIGAIFVSVALLILATWVPFLQIALNTVPLALADWGLIALVTGTIFVAGEVKKVAERALIR